MAVHRFYNNEINLVKERLINTSLIVSFFAGLPLMFFSIVRSVQFRQVEYIIINSLVFLSIIVLAAFRKRVKYVYKAFYVILLLIVLAVTDFVNIGIMSTGYMWMVTAAILAFLYFDIKTSIITVIVSVTIIFIIRILVQNQIITYSFDYERYSNSVIILYIRTLNFILIAFVVVFSIRQITNKFNVNLERLSIQRQNLMNSAIRMKREMDQRQISERNALASEYKFRNIFESSADPITIVGMNGRFLDFNKAFVELVRVDQDQLRKISFMEVVPRSYVGFYQRLIDDLENVPPRYELKYVDRQTGKMVFLDVTSTKIEYEGSQAVLAIFRDNTVKINQERSIYSAALEGEERERLRLSKELHDGLGPLLSTLKIYYEALEKRPADDEIQRRIKAILNESINSVKEISNNLSPYVLQNLGVTKALKAFIDKIVFAGKLDIELNSNVNERLDEKTEITVYRLITEMLNNTIKHANASKVFINLMQNSHTLNIEYLDDGIGFDAAKLNELTGGIGLFNMKSRIEKMGGNCEFISAVGKGFKMKAEVILE